MAEKINIEIDTNFSLLIFRVIGEPPVDDIVRAIENRFPEHMADNAIWDLTGANLSTLDLYSFAKIADAGQKVAQYRRPGSRTAIVSNGTAERLLLKVYTSLSEMSGSPIDYKICSDRADGLDWVREQSG